MFLTMTTSAWQNQLVLLEDLVGPNMGIEVFFTRRLVAGRISSCWPGKIACPIVPGLLD
jgi:hypothetical protein